MSLTTRLPQPTDYLGAVWALAGLRGVRTVCHGAAGCAFYDFIGYRELDPTRWAPPAAGPGLTETDVVNGGEEKLAAAVLAVDRTHRPGLIALVNTTVAALMGTDPHALARELQPQVQARLIAFAGGGMRGPYTLGAAEVLATLAREWVEPPAGRPDGAPVVNLIGPTWDTFNWAADTAEIARLLGLLGVRVGSVLTADTDLEQLRRAGSAHLNLVLRDVGLPAAAVLAERCGTPYLYGLPFGGDDTGAWLTRVAERLGLPGPGAAAAADRQRYRTRLEAVSPWHEVHAHLRVAVAAPYDYALGFTRLLAGEWHLQVPLVVLPVPPVAPGAAAALADAGAGRVLVEPGEDELAAALAEVAPHILCGSAEDARLAPAVPVHIRAARPSYDEPHFHDGTPFAGHRGQRWLAQRLAAGMYAAGPAGLRI